VGDHHYIWTSANNLPKKKKEKRRKTSKYNSLKTKQKLNQLIKKKEEVKNDLKALPGNRRKKEKK
jgi:hypothetical protein